MKANAHLLVLLSILSISSGCASRDVAADSEKAAHGFTVNMDGGSVQDLTGPVIETKGKPQEIIAIAQS
jgi:hypothetical protein